MHWKNILSQAAPLLGSILGGPLGANAGQLIGKLLLNDDHATDTEIEQALLNLTPTQLIALKQMEADLQTKMSQFALEKAKLAEQDRESARMREIQTRDKMPAFLATLLTFGFFGILTAIMFWPIEKEAREIINIMLGALGTAWISCITYYFGSSHGSQTKNLLLNVNKHST